MLPGFAKLLGVNCPPYITNSAEAAWVSMEIHTKQLAIVKIRLIGR